MNLLVESGGCVKSRIREGRWDIIRIQLEGIRSTERLYQMWEDFPTLTMFGLGGILEVF